MKERVSLIIGKSPIILIAPHGSDDTNTDIITESAARKLNCYAVINRGFERHETVDVNNDKANCNRIDHCREDVVFDEFLKPICKFTQQIENNGILATLAEEPYTVNIFHIHGCGDIVHKIAGEPVEVIAGYGLGLKSDSLSCGVWKKNAFVAIYRKFCLNGDIFEGIGGGKYAGRDKNNMNQYFKNIDPCVESMQLEFPFSSRNTPEKAKATGENLAVVLKNYIACDKYDVSVLSKLI
jgi:hypothetical protein